MFIINACTVFVQLTLINYHTFQLYVLLSKYSCNNLVVLSKLHVFKLGTHVSYRGLMPPHYQKDTFPLLCYFVLGSTIFLHAFLALHRQTKPRLKPGYSGLVFCGIFCNVVLSVISRILYIF